MQAIIEVNFYIYRVAQKK